MTNAKPGMDDGLSTMLKPLHDYLRPSFLVKIKDTFYGLKKTHSEKRTLTISGRLQSTEVVILQNRT